MVLTVAWRSPKPLVGVQIPPGAPNKMAVGEGFEPSVPIKARLFSRQVQ